MKQKSQPSSHFLSATPYQASSTRQLSSPSRQSSGPYETADSALSSDRAVHEARNDGSFSDEGYSMKNKKIDPLLVKALEQIKACFHGKMERFKAAKLLKHDGDFLIRLAKSDDDGTYWAILSTRWKYQHYHFHIKQKESLFWIEKQQFGSIATLLQYYMHTKKPVTQRSGALLVNAIISPKFSAAKSKNSAREKRMTEREKWRKMARLRNDPGVLQSPAGIIEVSKSLSFAILGENAPYILSVVAKVAAACIAIIGLYIICLY